MPEGVVAVVRREDRVLFVQQAPSFYRASCWLPPGGAIEPGETQADAVARETLEEAGVVVRPIRKVWECLSPRHTWRLHWWLAEYVSGEPSPDWFETSGAAWMTVEEFTALDSVLDTNLEFFCKVFPALAK